MKCGMCKTKIDNKDDENFGHKIVSSTMGGLWKGKSWRLYLCDKCNNIFNRRINTP